MGEDAAPKKSPSLKLLRWLLLMALLTVVAVLALWAVLMLKVRQESTKYVAQVFSELEAGEMPSLMPTMDNEEREAIEEFRGQHFAPIQSMQLEDTFAGLMVYHVTLLDGGEYQVIIYSSYYPLESLYFHLSRIEPLGPRGEALK